MLGVVGVAEGQAGCCGREQQGCAVQAGVSRGWGSLAAPAGAGLGLASAAQAGVPGQDLAERREICLAHPQEPSVAHGP